LNKDGERIHFTFFVSASNFIADTSRNIYEGPHQRCGYSRINFGGTPEQIRKRVDYVNALYRSGHELPRMPSVTSMVGRGRPAIGTRNFARLGKS